MQPTKNRKQKDFHLYWAHKDVFLVIIPWAVQYKSCFHSIYIVLDTESERWLKYMGGFCNLHAIISQGTWGLRVCSPRGIVEPIPMDAKWWCTWTAHSDASFISLPCKPTGWGLPDSLTLGYYLEIFWMHIHFTLGLNSFPYQGIHNNRKSFSLTFT